jgi:hypothetical protein
LSNNYIPGSEGETANNGSSFTSRREFRASNMTGALPPLITTGIEHHQSNTFDFEQMLQSLHDLFEHDRHVASQSDATRCGICYLHFSVSELQHRDEGFYICADCAHTLGQQKLHMLRKQQKM